MVGQSVRPSVWKYVKREDPAWSTWPARSVLLFSFFLSSTPLRVRHQTKLYDPLIVRLSLAHNLSGKQLEWRTVCRGGDEAGLLKLKWNS